VLDINEIMKLIPHRYPFLLVDRVVEMEAGKRIVALKNVTANEPFFAGHFPGYPVMPGVLMIEALAQAGGVLLYASQPELQGRIMYFAGIDNARFRRPVRPGDVLRLEVVFTASKRSLTKMTGRALVDGEVAAEADLSAVVAEAFPAA